MIKYLCNCYINSDIKTISDFFIKTKKPKTLQIWKNVPKYKNLLIKSVWSYQLNKDTILEYLNTVHKAQFLVSKVNNYLKNRNCCKLE